MPKKPESCPEKIGSESDSHKVVLFADSMAWDKEEKTAISVRDGVLEYYGAELGMEPVERVFTVYRSPATIAQVSAMMPSLPITIGHVPLDEPVRDPVGSVVDSNVIDLIDEAYQSHLALKNKVAIDPRGIAELEMGKRELSLGYKGKLVPSDGPYDFEQRDLAPQHLSIVEKARGGVACSFLDNKPKEENNMPKLHKAFCDEDGAPNLQQVVEIAMQLPDALKAVPLDKIQEVLPMLQEIIAMAGGGSEHGEATEEAGGDQPVTDEGAEKKDALDADKGDDGDDKKEDDGDDKDKKENPFTDSQQFKDALTSALEVHTAVIEKAQDFLDESYVFKGKSTDQIMRDALAQENGKIEFADAEIPVAFKLLKRQGSSLANFGDSKNEGPMRFADLAEQE